MVVSSIGISLGGLVVRSIDSATVSQINFYRSISLLIAIAIIMNLVHKNDAPVKFRAMGHKGLLAGCILGIAGVTYLQALTHTSIAITMFAMGVTPFLSAIIARLVLKEAINRKLLVAMGAAFSGIILMLTENTGVATWYGNMMAMLTALGYAAYSVLLRANRDVEMLPTVFVAGLVVIGLSVFPSSGGFGISLHDLALCIVWGGFISGLSHWFLILASKYLIAAELTLFMLLEIALAPLWVWYLLGETMAPKTQIGGAIVCLAIMIIAVWELRNRANR